MASLFGSSEKKPPPPPAPIAWVRNRNGNFSKLVTLDAARAGVTGGGVFVIWHSGAKPKWVMVGESDNLAQTIDGLRDDMELLEYDARGGLFIAWALIKPEYRPGIVKYLRKSMKPLLERGAPIDEKVAPIPVIAPGGKDDAAPTM